MKKTATAFALLTLTLVLLHPLVASAKKEPPIAEYSSIWNPTLNKWGDTVRTFEMVYSPEYAIITRNGKFRTTYSGFVPATEDVYETRIFWDPNSNYSRSQVDSMHEDGSHTPVRFDTYDRSMKGRVSFTRSNWNGIMWIPSFQSVSETDTLGIVRSIVNRLAPAGGSLALLDSTHVDVTQDMKGNVTAVKYWYWSKQEPVLQPIEEQLYTLNGDGSIASAEIWDNSTGELKRARRLHGFDWAVRNKSFSYVPREQGLNLLYGGDGYRSVIVDLPSGSDWSEFYRVEQGFDQENRVTSYTFMGVARDSFTFEDGLVVFNQHDEVSGGNWLTNSGSKLIFERGFNGELRSVISQRYNPSLQQYVNDRLYFYTFATASVDNEHKAATVSLYPNPVASNLRIEASEPIKSVRILNLMGQTLLLTKSSQVDVRDLPAGSYTVMIETVNGTEVLKFVKSE